MKTVLDDFETSFLYAAAYADGELHIIVIEGFRAAEPADITVAGRIIKDTYAVDVSDHSRLVKVWFAQPIAWQLVDESYTAFDKYELREDGSRLQVLTRSRYLDFINDHHGWYQDIRGPAKHYRVWTENEIMDVVSCDPPTVDFTKKP